MIILLVAITINNPKILLADEPIGAFMNLAKQCKRIIEISDGRILE